jgi:signal peptidase II
VIAFSKVLLVLIASGVFWADWVVKALIETHLLLGEVRPVWPSVWSLTHLENTGVAYSVAAQAPKAWILGITFGLLLVVGTWALSQRALSPLKATACGLILGGGFNNWVERFREGQVTDYLQIDWFDYPVFNLSDMAIVCGCVLLAWTLLKHYSPSAESEANPAMAQHVIETSA